jgi:hypothetical protein
MNQGHELRTSSGAKALEEKEGLIAALKALRHPKSRGGKRFAEKLYAYRVPQRLKPLFIGNVLRRGLRDPLLTCSTPTACAVGYILSPLRGWDLSRFNER